LEKYRQTLAQPILLLGGHMAHCLQTSTDNHFVQLSFNILNLVGKSKKFMPELIEPIEKVIAPLF
jgi:hypothetical protein